jgi:hypothetical protein
VSTSIYLTPERQRLMEAVRAVNPGLSYADLMQRGAEAVLREAPLLAGQAAWLAGEFAGAYARLHRARPQCSPAEKAELAFLDLLRRGVVQPGPGAWPR